MKKLSLIILCMSIAQANASDITLSKGIKDNLRSKIQKDLKVLDNLQIALSPNTLGLLGIENSDGKALPNWLEQRVSYVVEENALSVWKLLLKRVIGVEQTGVAFPNQELAPYSLGSMNAPEPVKDDQPKEPAQGEQPKEGQPQGEQPKEEQAQGEQPKDDQPEGGEGVTVMSNVGAALYYGGKTQQTVYSMKVSRGLLKKAIKVSIDSPRAGIIQIGEGLFDKRLTVNNQNPGALVNSLNRLTTFFHEARHSDGNGESLSFLHAICPAGHDMAGVPACDESLNGPYAVGAHMAIEFIKACDDQCTERDKEIMKLIAVDSYNRLLSTTHKGEKAKVWDATPESLDSK